MNNQALFEKLSTVTGSYKATISPGPITIAVTTSDAMAAKLLLWLIENMPEGATSQDLHDVLDSAKWWAIFTESMQYAEER